MHTAACARSPWLALTLVLTVMSGAGPGCDGATVPPDGSTADAAAPDASGVDGGADAAACIPFVLASGAGPSLGTCFDAVPGDDDGYPDGDPCPSDQRCATCMPSRGDGDPCVCNGTVWVCPSDVPCPGGAAAAASGGTPPDTCP
jgi:hypothetical protein